MADEMVFELMNRCDCCRKALTKASRAVVIAKFPDGGSDTVCVACYKAMTQAAIAWYSFEGTLPSEEPERRLERAADIATAQRAVTVLEGIIWSN